MKLSYSFIAVLLVTLFTGCKQDFDVTADYKEIPVVYGLLNQQDNVHYIRIQKGYLIDGNAMLATGVSDSIYYPDSLTVKLIPISVNGSTGTPILLTRVDGNNVGLPKEPGLFANVPNWLYSFSNSLDPNKQYRLEITNRNNGAVFKNVKDAANRDLTLVNDFHISTPSYGVRINLQNQSPSKAVWNSALNAGIYDLTVRFYYREYEQATNALLKDTFTDLVLLKSFEFDYTGGNVTPYEITSDYVLNLLARQIQASPSVYREFNIQKGMQFKFAAGGTELAKFMRSQLAQGGLASNEALPPYTNIENGVGLMSSRFVKQVDSVLLTDKGLDSLACSAITSGLRFKNHSGLTCQ